MRESPPKLEKSSHPIKICKCYSITFLNCSLTFDPYYTTGVWLGEDQRTNTIKKHTLKRDWTTSLVLDYSF